MRASGVHGKPPCVVAVSAADRRRVTPAEFAIAWLLIAACNYFRQLPAPKGRRRKRWGKPRRRHERPAILPDRRSEEDWSVLADPRVAREPLDRLKYIPLSPANPSVYLSLGANLRERFELDHGTFFGAPAGESGQWLLSRLEWHADVRLGKHVQIFTQFQNAVAPGKARLAPVDQNRLDVEQAFIGLTEPLGGGILRLRLGRQVLAIEFQRFASVREGPNLRQSYDAAFADYERGGWHVIGAYEQPVQTQDVHPFDDYSNHHLTFAGVTNPCTVTILGKSAVPGALPAITSTPRIYECDRQRTSQHHRHPNEWCHQGIRLGRRRHEPERLDWRADHPGQGTRFINRLHARRREVETSHRLGG